MKAWMDGREKLMGWMMGGGIVGNVVAFFAGFFMGILQNLVGPHAAPVSGFDLHSLKQDASQHPQMAVLPWLLFWVLGYSLSTIANRAFDCSANPSCIAYPPGPMGGGSGGGW